MELNKYKMVLGSQSPRRKELLSWLNIPFVIKTADLEEISLETIPDKIALDLALQKGRVVFDQIENDLKNAFVVSSDTIVVLDQKIYGKPKDRVDAEIILSELSGRTHQVITAVSFIFNGGPKKIEHTFFDSTDVTFGNITSDLMRAYLDTGDSLDKAGAYGIQGPSLTFITRINGSYSNVVGFPLDKVVTELERLFGPAWKERFS